MSNLTILGYGPLPWIDIILLGWFVLTALSVLYVAWDASTNNPEMTVMKWGCGINFAIGSKGATLRKSHQDTLVVGGIVFKRKPSTMPAGAVSVIP